MLLLLLLLFTVICPASCCVYAFNMLEQCPTQQKLLQLTTTLFPQPFGPTMQVKSAKGPITVLSRKLLKPAVDIRSRRLQSVQTCLVTEHVCSNIEAMVSCTFVIYPSQCNTVQVVLYAAGPSARLQLQELLDGKAGLTLQSRGQRALPSTSR
jgi:hypothetical protein